MKKSLIIIGITIVFIVIALVSVTFWVNGLKEDQRKTKEKMDLVLKSYDKFNKNVDAFSDLRNNLYEYKEDLYMETLSEKALEWNSFIEKFEASIKEIESSAKNLKDNCDIKYGDVNTNSKCTAFKANYEAAHNYYITDVKMYNSIVDEYQKWALEQKKDVAEIKKASFPVYKDYIDYDNDGECFGKEVEINE